MMSVPLPFRPIVRVSVTDEDSRREAFAIQFGHGVVQQFSCIERGQGDSLIGISRFYAHRTHPSIFEQDVAITNPSKTDAIVGFDQLGWTGDPPFKSELKKYVLSRIGVLTSQFPILKVAVILMLYVIHSSRIQNGDEELSYVVGSGIIQSSKGLIGAALVYKKVPNAIEVSV